MCHHLISVYNDLFPLHNFQIISQSFAEGWDRDVLVSFSEGLIQYSIKFFWWSEVAMFKQR